MRSGQHHQRCNWTRSQEDEGDNNNRESKSFFSAPPSSLLCNSAFMLLPLLSRVWKWCTCTDFPTGASLLLLLQTNFVLTLSILQLLHQGNLILPINALQARRQSFYFKPKFGGWKKNGDLLFTHWGKNQDFIQKLPRIWCLKNVNIVKKWDYEIVNFVKNEIFKL